MVKERFRLKNIYNNLLGLNLCFKYMEYIEIKTKFENETKSFSYDRSSIME